MRPIKVPETNHTFTRPSTMTEDECFDMPVIAGKRDDGYPEIVSVWELTDEEIEHICKTKRLYHGTLGAGIPPMWISVFQPKFPVMPETKGNVIGMNRQDIINN